MIKLNKKQGGEKVLSAWWFVVLAFVGLCIVTGVFIFNGISFNVQKTESKILYVKLLDCLNEKGYLSSEIFNSDFDIFEKCSLSKNLFKQNVISFKIDLKDSSGKDLIKPIYSGGKSFEKTCEIKLSKEINAKNFPDCIDKKIPIIYKKDNSDLVGSLEIITSSSNVGGPIRNE